MYAHAITDKLLTNTDKLPRDWNWYPSCYMWVDVLWPLGTSFSLTWKVITPTLKEMFKLCCDIGYKNQLMHRESLCRTWILYVIRNCHGTSFQNVNTKREHTVSRGRIRCLRRSTERLSNHEGDAVKARDYLELNLARDVKGSRDFHRHMDSRRKTREMESICWMGQRGWG